MTDETPIDDPRALQILEFWLGPAADRADPDAALKRRWYSKSAALDDELRREFGADLERAARGELDRWAATPRGVLALVVLLDQWTRNIHRDSSRMFENDPKALAFARGAVDRGLDRQLAACERQFLYMPFMHAESLADQVRSLELFEGLARDAPGSDVRAFARSHHAIVARFGRFPHRNALLDRVSSEAETAFLAEPNSSF